MSSRAGSIDPKITGDLVKKFGESMPVPFLENVTVHDNGIDVTLTMYFDVTQEQIEHPKRFKNSIKNMKLSVYFMLLVSEAYADLRNNEGNYNYEKLLKNINKKQLNSSHILNYITPYFYAIPTETLLSDGRLFSDRYGPITPADLAPVYRNCFPQLSVDGLFNNSIEAGGGATSSTKYTYTNLTSLTEQLNTNTYKIDISEFELSDVFYSKNETPIISMSVTKTLNTKFVTSVFSSLDTSAPDSMYAQLIEPTVSADNFFGISNFNAFGIKKLGIVSFTSLFDNLDRDFNAVSGIQNMFRSSKDATKFYKSFVSDISHVQVMEDGIVLDSELLIFEDQAGEQVEASEAIQSINSEYYAQDNIKMSDIVEGLNELVVETPESAEAQQLVNSLGFILSEYGSDLSLLPQLNNFRTQIPDRAVTTPVGLFYERIKIKIYNANQLVMQGRKLKRILVKNAVLTDIRKPLVKVQPYRSRDDYFITNCTLSY